MFGKLPARIKELAELAYQRFLEDPDDPLLENHELHDHGRGRHKLRSRSVSVNYRYRAIYVHDPDDPRGPTNVWYWIGSHESYNNFVGT